MAVKRTYRLNLKNYGNLPAIMLSQYDEGYALEFEIRDGMEAAGDLSGYAVTLKGTRYDTLSYSFTGTVSSNVLTFVIDTTMTACAGKGTAEIVITGSNDVVFASFNMPVFVEKAAVPDDAVDADVERAQSIAEQIQEIVDTAAEETTAEARQIVADVEDELAGVKEDLSAMSSATSEDVGKALKAKTVADGKVTEWEFGEAGTPSAANWSANAVQLLVGLLQSAVYTSDKSADIEALADELAYAEPTISGTLIKDWQFTGENPLVDKIDGSLAYAGSLISMSSKGAILPAVGGGANAYLSIPLSAYSINYVGTKVVVNFGEVYLDSMTAGTPYRLMVPCDAENKVSTGQMVGLAYVYQSTKSGDFNGRSFFGIRTSGADYPFDNSIFGENNPKLLEKSQTIFYFPNSNTLQITVNGDAVYSGSNKFTSAGIAFGSNRNYVFPCAIKRIRIYKEEQA